MTATAFDVDRSITGGQMRRLPLQASANPFSGSLMSFAPTGYVHELVAGEPFAGISRQGIPTANSPSADGGIEVELVGGTFVALLAVSGAAIDDVYHRRLVYASDDNTFTFTPSGNTLIGCIIGIDAGGNAIVLCRTAELQVGPTNGNIEVLADAAATLTTAQLDKLLVITPTAGRALTLPTAADCAGRSFTIKTLAAQIITITRAGSDTIDGATTFVACDAANDVVTIQSNGTAWYVTSARIQ